MNRQDPNRTERPQRMTFLLRVWRAEESGSGSWLASLERPGSGERTGFASLEQLFVYLVELSENGPDGQEHSNQE